MNQFCKMKGIMRQYSVARNPQLNRVAERRNKTLIEATRTMLADSKLPTTLSVEVVNTACYVQNKVLVVKPHNKTLYKLFHVRIPSLRFMRPFGCFVTILNTKDHLGKFDGKADEGFFVGYSLNSKAFRVFNNKTRIVEENLHIRFSENTLNIARSGTNWHFDIDALGKSMNYKPVVAGNYDDGKKVNEDPRQDSECKYQEKEDNVNITNNINDVGINEVNVVGINTNNELPFDLEKPAFKDISTFNFSSDHEDDDEEADMNNMDTTIQVSHVATTRIHKGHPIDQVIRYQHSTTQTRHMSKNLEEHGFFTTIHQRTNHKDLQNGLMSQVSTSIPTDVVRSKASDLSTIDGDNSDFAGSLNIQDANLANLVKEQKHVSNNDHVACEKKVKEIKNFKGIEAGDLKVYVNAAIIC
nr:putative ribonuclease H-like domain-containing protein [Tanacetum cinerariifolium]